MLYRQYQRFCQCTHWLYPKRVNYTASVICSAREQSKVSRKSLRCMLTLDWVCNNNWNENLGKKIGSVSRFIVVRLEIICTLRVICCTSELQGELKSSTGHNEIEKCMIATDKPKSAHNENEWISAQVNHSHLFKTMRMRWIESLKVHVRCNEVIEWYRENGDTISSAIRHFIAYVHFYYSRLCQLLDTRIELSNMFHADLCDFVIHSSCNTSLDQNSIPRILVLLLISASEYNLHHYEKPGMQYNAKLSAEKPSNDRRVEKTVELLFIFYLLCAACHSSAILKAYTQSHSQKRAMFFPCSRILHPLYSWMQ